MFADKFADNFFIHIVFYNGKNYYM